MVYSIRVDRDGGGVIDGTRINVDTTGTEDVFSYLERGGLTNSLSTSSDNSLIGDSVGICRRDGDAAGGSDSSAVIIRRDWSEDGGIAGCGSADRNAVVGFVWVIPGL